VNSLLNVYNPADPVLQRYHLVTQRHGDRAIGQQGIYAPNALAQTKLRQLNAAGIVGRDHSWDRYFSSPSLMNQTRAHLIW
jgi:hypothetical protein